MLVLVPTPIGNLKDITLRALEALQSCDEIVCEDTRRTSVLLNHFQINKPLTALNDFNEKFMIPTVLAKLIEGKKICLVSDAGTPLISDPGYKLVREALREKIEVDSLPGPSSILPALTLSGLPPDKFMFLGYPPEKPGHRQKFFQNIKSISEITPTTFINFIAPHKIIKTLEEMKQSFGDIEVILAKELTKVHQRVESKNLSKWLEEFKNTPKGEYVLLFHLKIV